MQTRNAPEGGNGSEGGDRKGSCVAEKPGRADDSADMWSVCLAIARHRRLGSPCAAFAIDAQGAAIAANHGDPGLRAERRSDFGWVIGGGWSVAAAGMFELYRPLLDLSAGQRYVVGHLGQSIDGRIATSAGDSCFINGQQNLIHMHRLRALCDAVLVGAGTVVADDPQLTTRLVPGPDASRVVLDPSSRLTPSHRICSDERGPTLVARFAPSSGGSPGGTFCGKAEIISAAASATGIDLPGLLDSLAARGLNAVLVEGGGITVSRFLAQGLLDRLQIAIAPVIIGSGRQGLQLPEVLALRDCLRPACRLHQMGPDVLWDLDMRAGEQSSSQDSAA